MLASERASTADWLLCRQLQAHQAPDAARTRSERDEMTPSLFWEPS